MPAGEAASIEDEPLDANIGRLTRLQFDPVTVDLDLVIEVRCHEEGECIRSQAMQGGWWENAAPRSTTAGASMRMRRSVSGTP